MATATHTRYTGLLLLPLLSVTCLPVTLTNACCVRKGRVQRKPLDCSASRTSEHGITRQGHLSDVSGQQALQQLPKVRKRVRVYLPTQSAYSRIFPRGKGEQRWVWGMPSKEFHSWGCISGARSKSSKRTTPSPPSICPHFPFQPADSKRNRQGAVLDARPERPSFARKRGTWPCQPP